MTSVIEIERERSQSATCNQLTRLKEPFMPCPICRGSTDIAGEGYAFCCSCGQKWTIFGEPRG